MSDDQLIAAANSTLIRYCPSFLPGIIHHANGSFVYDGNNREILDFTSGQMSAILGHRHPEISSTVASHAQDGITHLFSGMLSPPVIEFAQKLTSLLPSGLDKVQLLSTGGESNECAFRIAKLYTGKFEIVALSNSWHGVTFGTASLTYQPTRKGYGPSAPGSLILPAPNAYRSPFRHPDGTYDWEAELNYGWSLIDSQSVGSLAAVVVEPILSSGGVIVLPPGYLAKMKEHCVRRGMLLIVDEAQTGIGRTGKNFAFEHDGVIPDILTLSKTLGAGLPLSAVVTSKEIEETVHSRGFSFFTTHVSDPLPAAIGIKVLEILERDRLADRAQQLGEVFTTALKALQRKYPCIGDVRGQGLMVGMEIIKEGSERREPNEELGNALADKMFQLGLSANVVRMPGTASCFRMAPPLTITEEELKRGLQIIEKAFEALASRS